MPAYCLTAELNIMTWRYLSGFEPTTFSNVSFPEQEVTLTSRSNQIEIENNSAKMPNLFQSMTAGF